MHFRECEVIGCLEAAVWARSVQADYCLEDFLCNGCWLLLAAKQPQQAAFYVLCEADIITYPAPISSSSTFPLTGDTIVIQ